MSQIFTKWLTGAWKFIVGLAIFVGLLVSLIQLNQYWSESRSAPTSHATVIPKVTCTTTASPTPTKTPVGPFQFITLPKQVKAGEDVIVKLRAYPDAVCHLDFFTPNGTPSQADGLGTVIPDSRSICTWEWHIRADMIPGVGQLVAMLGDLEETHEIEILPGE